MGSVKLIYVPYDSGRMGERFGRGPLAVRQGELPGRLGARHAVTEDVITHGGAFVTEATLAFDLAARISRSVAQAGDAFPLVVAGNCSSSWGTVSGMAGARCGVIWFDAHPDFNTPETSISGFLDGMASAVLVGEGWTAAAKRIPGFRPIDRRDLLLIGARDIDPDEAVRLADPPVARFSGDDFRSDPQAVRAAIVELGRACDAVYLHFDMDVTEPMPVPANQFAAPGGLDDDEVTTLLEIIAAETPLRSAGVTAYDPRLDSDGSMLKRYHRVIEQIAELGSRDA